MEGRRWEIIFLFYFLFSLFFIYIYIYIYIYLSKDCIQCNAYTSDEEWVPVVECVGPIIPAATQYGRSIHKSFLTRNICVEIKTGIWGMRGTVIQWYSDTITSLSKLYLLWDARSDTEINRRGKWNNERKATSLITLVYWQQKGQFQYR